MQYDWPVVFRLQLDQMCGVPWTTKCCKSHTPGRVPAGPWTAKCCKSHAPGQVPSAPWTTTCCKSHTPGQVPSGPWTTKCCKSHTPGQVPSGAWTTKCCKSHTWTGHPVWSFKNIKPNGDGARARARPPSQKVLALYARQCRKRVQMHRNWMLKMCMFA